MESKLLRTLIFLSILWGTASQLHAEESDRSASADSDVSAVLLASQTTSVTGDGTAAPFAAEESVRRFRKHPIQKITASGGTLLSRANGGIQQGFYELSIETAVPLGSYDNLLGITPSFRTDFFDVASGAGGFNMPSELFDAGVSFYHRRPINDRWSATAVVRPAIRSDMTTSENAMRIFGLGMLNWDYRPDRLSISMGAVFLDRADLPLLPALGVTWTPNRRHRVELRFPESRWLVRLFKNGCQNETWGYLSAGVGGNTWAVTRANAADELSLRDFRLMVGVDHVVDGGGGWFVECGGAFDRRLEYETTGQEVSLGSSVLLQGGIRF